jgi:hypothetical protein
LSIAQDEQSTEKRDEANGANPTRPRHSEGYLSMSIAANSKRPGGYCGGKSRHSMRADRLISAAGRGLLALPIQS